MAEVSVDIFRDESEFCFSDLESGEHFVHEGALFVKVEGIGEGFEVNAVDLKNGNLWNFHAFDTVRICKRVNIIAWMGMGLGGAE